MKLAIFILASILIIILVWALDAVRKRRKTLYLCDYYDGIIKDCYLKWKFLFINVYAYTIEYVDGEERPLIEAVEHKITLFKKKPKELKDKEIVIAKSKYYKDKATVIEFKKRYFFFRLIIIACLVGIYFALKKMGAF